MTIHWHSHRNRWMEEASSETRWQRHVMAAIWVALALFFAIAGSLYYANNHGYLRSTVENAPAVPDTLP